MGKVKSNNKNVQLLKIYKKNPNQQAKAKQEQQWGEKIEKYLIELSSKNKALQGQNSNVPSEDSGLKKHKLKHNKFNGDSSSENSKSKIEIGAGDIADINEVKGVGLTMDEKYSQIPKGIKAAIKLKHLSKKKHLLTELPMKLSLTVNLIRTPVGALPRVCRKKLTHSLLTSSSDVCFFACDLRGHKSDPEASIEYHRDLLNKYGINGITEIIPLKRLAADYRQIEANRKLCHRFEMFLVDGKISHRVAGLLGKQFSISRKMPHSVTVVDSENLKKEFEDAMKKVSYTLKENNDIIYVEAGNSFMKKAELEKNVRDLYECIDDIPGGWNNVRSIFLRWDDQPYIPLYWSLKPANDVKIPIVESRRKLISTEIGEVGFKNVKVLPSGEIKLMKNIKKNKKSKKVLKKDDLSDEENMDEVDSEEDEEKILESGNDLEVSEETHKDSGSEFDFENEMNEDSDEDNTKATENNFPETESENKIVMKKKKKDELNLSFNLRKGSKRKSPLEKQKMTPKHKKKRNAQEMQSPKSNKKKITKK